MPLLNAKEVIEERVGVIRALHQQAGNMRAELDLSGGIDSAVMLGLLALALGPENVTAIFLGINSNPDALDRAQGLADAMGVRLIRFDGTPLFDRLLTDMTDAMVEAGYDRNEVAARIERDPTILGSIRSTLRAPWGRAANRLSGGGIRHGTGNECEDRWVRFYQKGGDGEVDTNPISFFSKGEVYQIALALGTVLNAQVAYDRIINATPSADLWGVGDKHNDESEIGNYLGVKGYPYYSYIEADGDYRTVGLIERVSRFLDTTIIDGIEYPASMLFADHLDENTGILNMIIETAVTSLIFDGVDADTVRNLLRNARRIERMTRHKMNPNCPALGDRQTLIQAGWLTNDLPVAVSMAETAGINELLNS